MARAQWCRTFVLAVVAWAVAPAVASAQQNLFNVPSGEVTAAERVFFQNQFNINRLIQSNSTVNYGLGRGFELGLNVFDVPLYNPNLHASGLSEEIQTPDFLVNGLKSFEITDRLHFGVGAQFGLTSPVFDNAVRPVNFTYGIGSFELPEERGKLYAGLYYANQAYRGRGDPVGIMLGCDIPILPKKVHFMADFLSGRSDISVAVIGGVFYIPGGLQISVGGQLPGPGTNNGYGAVIELTYVPKSD